MALDTVIMSLIKRYVGEYGLNQYEENLNLIDNTKLIHYKFVKIHKNTYARTYK